MASRPPTEPCVPVWYTAPPLFMPLQTCGSKNKRTNSAFSSLWFERAVCSIGLDAICQYPFLELARMPAFLLEIPSFSRFLHLVRTLFHFFQNTMRIRLSSHRLRLPLCSSSPACRRGSDFHGSRFPPAVRLLVCRHRRCCFGLSSCQ